MSGLTCAAYPEIVNPASGIAAGSAPEGAFATVRRAWRGLVRVLVGPEPTPVWHWRSSRERRAAYVALGLATLALCVINPGTVHGVASMHGPPIASTIQLPPTLGQRLLAVALVAPLPLAAWYPMLAWRVGWLALLLAPLFPAAWWGGWPWSPPAVGAMLAAFLLAGIRHGRPELWWMWALSLVPWCLWLVADVPHLNGPASATLIFTAATVAADSVGSRVRTQRALAVQTGRAEAEREERAVLEERSRIARELHDVVAHHLSLIAVQAETAPYRRPDLPESARAEFGSLSEVAREALADMRRLLGVLRQDQPAALAPQPQLADLPALVDAARKAGVPVELTVPPALDHVPSGVALCAYRIVQESLSNASQHAPGAAVTVSVGRDNGAILLRVANGPGGPVSPSPSPRGAGHGLTGMRERVALLGGSLAAGPAPGGGFVVSATLPLGQTP
jgi:signal transduction histidine kinase